jgi:hypothetical protein
MPHIAARTLYPGKELVITADNSGAIGEKERDAVRVSNETAGYFACRTAMMEQLAAGAEPYMIVLHNFTGDGAWDAYESSVHQVLDELQLTDISITGSTETNMTTIQSGLGVTVAGVRDTVKRKQNSFDDNDIMFAVIGTPLVGSEVKTQAEKIAPLALFRDLCQMEGVTGLLPSGSKGIQADWRQWTGRTDKLTCRLDTAKSAGPATCFIIAYQKEAEPIIRHHTDFYFHELKIAQRS